MLILTSVWQFTFVSAQEKETFNYDESRVGDYVLPDVLTSLSGEKMTTARQWESSRRGEILQLFKDHVYGEFPRKQVSVRSELLAEDKGALNGKATVKQVRIHFGAAPSGQWMDLLLYIPNHIQGPVPVFAGLNYFGNQTVYPDTGLLITRRWTRNAKREDDVVIAENNRVTEASRGYHTERWQVEKVIQSGYGIATVYYGDLEGDHPEGWKDGIRYHLRQELGTDPAAWGAIGAWAWGLCRIMDYLEQEPAVDAQRVIVHGHSRLGKAALWAGANDQRFAAVISNNSGEGGAALARRWYGETVNRINTSFPHWFSADYKRYNHRVHNLPVDQHMLLSLMAPRPLYVASAEEDRWADPKGEFLSAKETGVVYALYGKPGVEAADMPPVNMPVGGTVHYHIRTGKHDITLYDWQQYVPFADKHLTPTLQ